MDIFMIKLGNKFVLLDTPEIGWNGMEYVPSRFSSILFKQSSQQSLE